MKRMLGLAALLVATAATTARVDAAIAYAISGGTDLIRFDTGSPNAVTVVGTFSGSSTIIDGIDFRPADGMLYGYDQTNNSIVTINTQTAVTTFVSTPSTASSTAILGIDFNPVPDRMRLVNTDDQNLRINVANGATTVDGTLAYGALDPNFGANPSIVDAAYTNSFAPSPRTPPPGTQLYYIDSGLDILVTTSSPNAGTLTTVGALGVDTTIFTGFDILSLSPSTNVAYAILGTGAQSGFYTINLSTGAATLVGNLEGVDGVYSLAVAVPEPASLALVVVPAALGLISWRRRMRRSA